MDCSAVASVLVAYHFATASDEERAAVDAHLVACRSCLETYLALKRAADAQSRDHERPSPDARARLRAEVARTFGARARRSSSTRSATFLARRIPLYQGVVAAAVAAALALAIPRLVTPKPEVGSGTPLLDTSRASAQSLSIY